MKIDSGMIGIASTSTPDYWIPMIVNMNFTKPKRANHLNIFSLQEDNLSLNCFNNLIHNKSMNYFIENMYQRVNMRQ